VKIQGLNVAEFSQCSGIKATIDVMEYREGGALAAYKEAGLISYENLTLERGMSDDEDFIDWVRLTIDMQAANGYGAGALSPDYKKDGAIQQLDRDKSIAMTFPFYDAFPAEWSGGDYDANSSEWNIESLVLAYRWADRRGIPG